MQNHLKSGLTEVTSASFIVESNVFAEKRLVEVLTQLARDSLTENVEDGCSHEDTNARELKALINEHHKEAKIEFSCSQ